MITDFFLPFLIVGLAELGDKTQLAVFCLSSKTNEYTKLLLGVMAAFLIADGLAIVFGDVLIKFLPINYIKLAAGLAFILIGLFTLFKKDEDELNCDLKTPFMSAFLLILLSEMGDKTQLAAGLFATEYNAFMVFFGVMFALFLLSVMAIFLGKFLFKHVKKQLISNIAGTLFVAIGVITLINI